MRFHGKRMLQEQRTVLTMHSTIVPTFAFAILQKTVTYIPKRSCRLNVFYSVTVTDGHDDKYFSY